MALKEYEKHIRDTREDVKHLSRCGVHCANEFAFLDIDHAVNTILMGSALLPCPECVKVVVNLLTNGVE